LRIMPAYYRGVDPVIDHDHGTPPGQAGHSSVEPQLPPVTWTEPVDPAEVTREAPLDELGMAVIPNPLPVVPRPSSIHGHSLCPRNCPGPGPVAAWREEGGKLPQDREPEAVTGERLRRVLWRGRRRWKLLGLRNERERMVPSLRIELRPEIWRQVRRYVACSRREASMRLR
jgi:hypothetical protein